MKNVVAILAGGVGTRLGADKPKQLLEVAGKTVIEHTVDAFHSHQKIDEIIIVSNKSIVQDIEELVKKNSWNKVTKVLNGGKERYDSTLSAIAGCSYDECNILLHDSVRPLVSHRIIDDVLKSLEIYDAVNVAVPVVDTIIECENGVLKSVPKRSSLFRVQTPQGFKLSTISKAFEIGLKDENFVVTDDCSVVHKYTPAVAIAIVEGEETNLKITHKEDIGIVDKIIKDRTNG